MSESIEKPKRTYVRKSKIVIDVPSLCDISTPLPSPDCVTPQTTNGDLGVSPKKRTYTRKPKCVLPQTTNGELEGLPLLSRDPPMQLSPPISPIADIIPPKEKKPRTEKQIVAFEKMRSARLSKQTELNDLKDLERSQKQLQTEQTKLDKITEKVLIKATELKTKRVSKKKVVSNNEEPQLNIQETKHKNIVFI